MFAQAAVGGRSIRLLDNLVVLSICVISSSKNIAKLRDHMTVLNNNNGPKDA